MRVALCGRVPAWTGQGPPKLLRGLRRVESLRAGR